MRLRTIISTFLAAAILPTDGQLVVQQRLRSLPEVGKDDPPMTMMELGKEPSSMSMMEFVDLSPTDLERELLKRNDSLFSFCFCYVA